MRDLVSAAVMAFMLCSFAGAQEDDTLLLLDFEEDTAGVVSADAEALMCTIDDPEVVFAGERSLQVDYMQEAATPGGAGRGFPGALVVPLVDQFGDLRGVSFAIATALSTPIVVNLSEGPEGPRYNCMLWCNSGAWHEYRLSLDDFLPDLNGPDDPNGTLDPGLVNTVSFLDADSFLRMLAEGTPLFHVDPPEEQTLWLDDLRLLGRAPEAPAEEGPGVTIGHYSPPLRGFAFIGGRDVNAVSEELADGGHALRVDYDVPPGTLFAIMHLVAPGSLAGMGAIRVEAMTNSPATLIVSVEERWGAGEQNKASYYALVPLESTGGWETLTIPVSSFNLGDNEVDPNGALDMDLVSTVMVGDGTAVLENTEVINSLWLRELVAVE